MLDFSPTEEQEEIRRLAHSIAVEQLRPQGRTAEKNGDISPALMQTLAQTGLTTPFPEKYGGSGEIEAITYALIAEELGFGDGALAMNIIGSLMGPLAVALAGNERQQEQYLVPFCDPTGGATLRGSLAFTERTGGYQLNDIRTKALLSGEIYQLSGTKRDVIHGTDASLRVVLARLADASGYEHLVAFVLPANLEGLQIKRDEQKLGLIAAPSAAYTFEHAQIPAAGALSEPGGAIRVATLALILRAAVACGTTRAALEYASEYAKERIAFGRPIVSYQSIAFMIAETAMKLDAVRLLLWNAAANWDRRADTETVIRDAEAAWLQAHKLSTAATIDAVQIMGGAGFMQDHPAEMWMRNAAAME